MRNNVEIERYRVISDRLGTKQSEVARVVRSFFGAMASEINALPFSDERRIYSHDLFDEYSVVCNIPYIGRLGTSYSRYLVWRRNESKNLNQVNRRAHRAGVSRDEIEHIAEEILSGGSPAIPAKKKNSELFNNIWLVGKHGKKLARQAIKKENENV